MISKTWTSWEQSYGYQTKMRGKRLRCCGQWCQRQQRDQEGKGMILFVILLHWWDGRERTTAQGLQFADAKDLGKIGTGAK